MTACLGCEHDRAHHYRDIDDVVRCNVVSSGVSSSGVIGIPWSYGCDCVNFTSKLAEYRRKQKADDDLRRSLEIQRIVDAAKEMFSKTKIEPPPNDRSLRTMSYSFIVRAATKAEAVTKAEQEFDKVVEGQPIHTKDQKAAMAAVKNVLDVLNEDSSRDVTLSVNGYVSWTEGERITGASVSVAANLVDR